MGFLKDRPKFAEFCSIEPDYESGAHLYYSDLNDLLLDLDDYLVEIHNMKFPISYGEILCHYTDDEILLLEKSIIWHDHVHESYELERFAALEKEKANRAFEKIILDK